MTTTTIGELENNIKIYAAVSVRLAELVEEQERLRKEIIAAFHSLQPDMTLLMSDGHRVRLSDGEIIIEE